MAYRLLIARGEWDVDAFLSSVPASKWEELKIAKALNDSYDDWLDSVRHGNKKPWEPPEFRSKNVRRTLSGLVY